MLFNKGALLITEDESIYLVVDNNEVNNVVIEVSLISGELKHASNPHIRPINTECIKWGVWNKFYQLSLNELGEFLLEVDYSENISKCIEEPAIYIK